ncbi:MAG: succinate dehydrogenase/fumarate reductase iron-sulfur subunit [Bryobacterales bacterium]|nr:succinate dehydrogenase/fumarate reductase iron-sulfur subunit [Bryobacterales bacterium]
MQLTLKVWRQKSAESQGQFKTYEAREVSPDMSFLEMLDEVNEGLIESGEEPIAFDHDCREGICGMCSAMINGVPHGPDGGTTTCQLHMRSFKDRDTIVIEPWRATALPVIRDLVVDRSPFDRIVQAGGFVSVNTGGAPDANLIPVPKAEADTAFDAATCIGCAACVAACKNASASLFTAAKIAHLRRMPQGRQEQLSRARDMVDQMDAEGFGGCTNTSDCEAACPKGISVDFISEMNADYFRAALKGA